MWQRRAVLSGGVALALTSCGPTIRQYDGPEVTRIVVQKSNRRMYLLHHQQVLTSYNIDLGFAPSGHKTRKGDGKTPVGTYYIDRLNPNSSFHLSLGISYPNEADVARAKEMNAEPGGDIFIHGARRKRDRKGADWTFGCISVSNREVEEIYSMVRKGTQIDLNP